MGTRGLTCVFKDGEYKIAQYGQWDHYPSGQGVTILDFLTEQFDRKKFEKQLEKIVFITDDLQKYDIFNYPQLSRDMGGKILEYVQNTKDEQIHLSNNIDFAMDGLFCEYAYVIDLDKNTFEVFRGFYTDDPPEGNRFVGRSDNGEYSAVHLIKVFNLDALPDEELFINVLRIASLDKDDIQYETQCLRDGSTNHEAVSEAICLYVENAVRAGTYPGNTPLNKISDAIEAILDDEINEYTQPAVNEICDFIDDNFDEFLKYLKSIVDAA